jgi:hypothetical protein
MSVRRALFLFSCLRVPVRSIALATPAVLAVVLYVVCVAAMLLVVLLESVRAVRRS